LATKTDRRLGELQQRKSDPVRNIERIYGNGSVYDEPPLESFSENEEKIFEVVDRTTGTSTFYKYRRMNGKRFKYQYSEIT